MTLDRSYRRYRHIVACLPEWARWLALVFAPTGLTIAVVVAGLVNTVSGLVITAGIADLPTSGAPPGGTLRILALAFLVQGTAFVVKERQEYLLKIVVQHVTFLRFRELFRASNLPRKVREQVLTYPGQISQFAYVVDAALSIVEILAFIAISLYLYGVSGLAAIALVVGLVWLTVVLIHRVGRLWEQYIEAEGERRHAIARLAQALPRGRFVPSYRSAIEELLGIREREEGLLRRRVRLQVLNGFVDHSALTVALALVALASVWWWPNSGVGLGMIIAARYLYAAVQNNLANYRVIRLAVPMMRELDALESRMEMPDDEPSVRCCPRLPEGAGMQVMLSTPELLEDCRVAALEAGAAYVPRQPTVPQAVLDAWRAEASVEQKERFARVAAGMELDEEVCTRLWQDVTTLSSGEKQRLALSLVLAEQPQHLLLDDVFAALEPRTREVVASVIVSEVPACTLLIHSPEYVPQSWQGADGVKDSRTTERMAEGYPTDGSSEAIQQAEGNGGEAGDAVSPEPLPDPDASSLRFSHVIRLLFGSHVIPVSVGAVLLAASDVGFALTVADGAPLSRSHAVQAAACIAAALAGCLLFFGTIHRVPIRRLTRLHTEVVERLPAFANPHTSGAVVGRFGEDFSGLQMSIPSAVGAVFLVTIQSLMLIAAASAGSPLFILVTIAILPLAVAAMRAGSRRILPAHSTLATARDRFLTMVTVQADDEPTPRSRCLLVAHERAYDSSQGRYVDAAHDCADAYALRSTFLQSLMFVLNFAALLLAAWAGERNAINAAAVIFFTVSLSSGLQATIETLQETGVVGMAAARVFLLETLTLTTSQPPLDIKVLSAVRQALDSEVRMIALIGPSGAGKSVLLDELCRCSQPEAVALIPERDPFAPESSDALDLLHGEMSAGGVQLLLLDETLKALKPSKEREVLMGLRATITSQGRQAITVLHSRSNLDCFDVVVNVDG